MIVTPLIASFFFKFSWNFLQIFFNFLQISDLGHRISELFLLFSHSTAAAAAAIALTSSIH